MRASILVALVSSLAVSFTGCGDDGGVDGGGSDGGPPMPIEPTYENVSAVITRSCTFTTACHGGVRGQANLIFEGVTDVTTVLNDVPSCQYDFMPRVDPGSPDTSWLMVKLTAEADAMNRIQFTADPSWVPDTSNPLCPGDGDFGLFMPWAGPRLPENEITMFREWIANGAPGPSGM